MGTISGQWLLAVVILSWFTKRYTKPHHKPLHNCFGSRLHQLPVWKMQIFLPASCKGHAKWKREEYNANQKWKLYAIKVKVAPLEMF